MSAPDAKPNLSLCDLMVQLKLKDPEMNKQEMHSAVLAEGSQWEKVTIEQIGRTWKKMKKKYKNKVNLLDSNQNQRMISEEETASGDASNKSLTDDIEALLQESSKANSMATPKPPVISKEKPKLVTVEEIRKAFARGTLGSNSLRSSALERQLQALEENPSSNYVIFTSADECADYGIHLTDGMGEVFFNVLWNRVIKLPYGNRKFKRELWMIYQQLEFSLLPKYRKMLRKQLQIEFGFDPFEGKN